MPSFFPDAVKQALSRFTGRLRKPFKPSAPPDPNLRSRAAAALREYAETNATLLDRAARLMEKAERLEREGTPSESARNRAERARAEIEAGLSALRASFSAFGQEGLHAFDHELESLYPALKTSKDLA